MITGSLPRRVAGVTALLGVAALATVGYLIYTFEPANDGGTSIAGLFFGLVIFVGVVTLVEAGLLAVFGKWECSTAWPRRILVAGVSLGGLSSLSVLLYTLTWFPSSDSRLGQLIDPLVGSVFEAALVFTLLGATGSGLGLVATVLTATETEDHSGGNARTG